MTETKRRGRPRSRETLARDAAVLKLIQEAPASVTRKQLEQSTGWHGRVVYPCLVRLRRSGDIVKENGNRYRPAVS